MPNMDVLKQRVEDAERRLLSVQSARERECDALMDMWHQIRNKFQDQEQEIADYRSKLTALQDMNVELASMIDSMLGSIEGSVERSFDHAVPEITGMAKELLDSEPGADADISDISLDEPEIDGSADPAPPATSATRDFEPGPTETPNGASSSPMGVPAIDELPYSPGYSTSETEEVADSDDDDDTGEILELTEPASPSEQSNAGIRSLITRIERAVNRSAGASDDSRRDGDVDQELEEIEHLRNELNGLRARISATGPAVGRPGSRG